MAMSLVKGMIPQRLTVQAATVRFFSVWSGSHPFARIEESASSRVPNSRRASVLQPPLSFSPQTWQAKRALSSETKAKYKGETKPAQSEEEVLDAVVKRMTNGKTKRVLFITGAGLSADSGEASPGRCRERAGSASECEAD